MKRAGALCCREREKMRLSSLKKLHKDATLQLVAPSDEIKTAYPKKSESHLTSARLLLDSDLFEQSVSMAYYSMYYPVLALFFATGIKCENYGCNHPAYRSLRY